jgi:hypothetical protein
LPDVCARAVFSPIKYKFICVTMPNFLRHDKEIEQELILEIASDEAVLCDNDSGHDED